MKLSTIGRVLSINWPLFGILLTINWFIREILEEILGTVWSSTLDSRGFSHFFWHFLWHFLMALVFSVVSGTLIKIETLRRNSLAELESTSRAIRREREAGSGKCGAGSFRKEHDSNLN